MNLKEQIDIQERIIMQTNQEIREMMVRQNRRIHEARNEIDKLKQSAMPKNHTIGDWDCLDSPLGLCVYHDKDTCQDSCIYCGQPDERK